MTTKRPKAVKQWAVVVHGKPKEFYESRIDASDMAIAWRTYQHGDPNASVVPYICTPAPKPRRARKEASDGK